ncbi:Leucine Rich repeats (2 copies) [Campylobacter devanensis]|uniref:leucine-rich repeat domain-containing protein n=1 Tax=Campylobacter devanensis TaxID=3161138 RepID=UPI000A34A436|nr:MULTISPECIES: leucine-rich repeat domain-containing protein [Campylobacter]SUX05177.1 Leucine Rich repeats (2 copies) [Campylobacter lanienae]
MIIHSDKPCWVVDFFKEINIFNEHEIININNIDQVCLDKINIFFIPILGEDELSQEWLIFFNKISSNIKNLGKTLIIFTCGVYDLENREDSVAIRQIKHICKFLSIRLFIYPLKLNKYNHNLTNMLHFINHIPNDRKSNFQFFIEKVVFETKNYPIVNNAAEINFISLDNGYENILSHYNKDKMVAKIEKICLLNDRKILNLSRLKKIDKNCISIFENIGNDHMQKLYLVSCSLHEIPFLKKHKKLRYSNLTANSISVLDVSYFPDSIEVIDCSKNIIMDIKLVYNNTIRKLCLFNNKIEKIDYLSNLNNLQYINLGLNPLISFPESIFDCKNIEHINLALTPIEYIPEEILTLKSLKILDLTYCNNLKNVSIIKKLIHNGVKVIV